MQIDTDNEVELFELSHERPVVVMVGQRGCPPCEATLPHFANLITKYATKYLGFVEVTENEDFIGISEVGEVPVFIKLENGEEVGRIIGRKTEQELIEFIGEDNG